MAIEFIEIDQNERLGQRLRNAIDKIAEGKRELADLKLIMEANIDGVDYTAVGTQFGVAGASAQTVYNLVAGANTALGASDIVQLLKRLG